MVAFLRVSKTIACLAVVDCRTFCTFVFLADLCAHRYSDRLLGSPNWQAIGSKMGIDATNPSILNDPKERLKFERTRPVEYGKVFLKDFLE